MQPYRPCKFRKSQFGIFQCEKHFFQNTTQETYGELYNFCKEFVPEKYCPHIDFGFSMQDGAILYINCTHTFKARKLKNFDECKECDFPDKESVTIT
ncbi:MAG: hypothetical protein ABIH00_10285 [Armatimonadota bacterium]